MFTFREHYVKMNEQDLIQEAIDRLYQATCIRANWHPGPAHLDGKLDVIVNGRPLQFFLEVKTEIRQHQVHDIEKMAGQY